MRVKIMHKYYRFRKQKYILKQKQMKKDEDIIIKFAISKWHSYFTKRDYICYKSNIQHIELF